ncbi:hypothetical protein [Haloactinomyces albus]|uniref:Uncharacterized protein n=1 Tax=Haloactinomyces albus TaxID=1352928 RepID=A0AAE3ZFI2_9ACTN|nr:hypothetical protein [Haloactinomyces albus]MDR7302302.1 hypothetical protein [Haloactinomyces albus]
MSGSARNGDGNEEDGRPTETVLRVLNEHDPEGLLALGAPNDEYEPEAEHLARLASQSRTITAEVVTEVWDYWFGHAGSFTERASPQDLEQLAAHLEAAVSSVRPP